ncbi:PASTA domain-containing protein [Streptomyces olindensis]|uniref:PASTA domain-containing protein n=1 Tax=Streptomyces olindensis TaxID=358823 RepID=UPI00340EDA58
MRKIAVLVVFLLALGGCDARAPLVEVRAVAAGVPSLAPFFAEDSGLGRDARVRSRPVPSGLQQGDTPGLYGGTEQPRICDVERLKRFLTAPRNAGKARAWATALELRTDQIPGYLDRLTPVLLRHDTLALNHDYRKGKAVPFRALLQAGIAVLVDEKGLPSVKCSCGNPLRPFEGDTGRISVTFEDGNEKWRGYDRSEVVVVRPASRELERIALVDVEDAERGIQRPVGTTGEADSGFDAAERRAVPRLAGTTFGEASRRLADAGLAVAYGGEGLPPDRARVTATEPGAGAELPFGAYVTVRVTTPPASPASPAPPAPPAGSGPPPSAGPTSTSAGPTGAGPTSTGATTQEPPSQRPRSSAAPSGSGPSSSSPAPPGSGSGSPATSTPPRSSAPPKVTDSPPAATGTPSKTTSPPPRTTSPPPQTSAPPPRTTSPPPQTSAPPPRTTSPPPRTTSVPPESSSGPVTTSPAPSVTL